MEELWLAREARDRDNYSLNLTATKVKLAHGWEFPGSNLTAKIIFFIRTRQYDLFNVFVLRQTIEYLFNLMRQIKIHWMSLNLSHQNVAHVGQYLKKMNWVIP